mmetsp:Transcript_40551/g.71324  ORF Transcript_40551/g.71324 Transcript_40551/m.71324 type:complete len:1627 (-) Transcript_40551:67-4947(-)
MPGAELDDSAAELLSPGQEDEATAGDTLPAGLLSDDGEEEDNALPDFDVSDRRRSIGVHKKMKALEVLQHDYTQKLAAAEDAKSTLDMEEQKLRAMRKQAGKGGRADPSQLGYQEKEVQAAWARLTEAENARDLAELAMHHVADVAAEAGAHVAQDNSATSRLARERKNDEVRRAKSNLEREHMAHTMAVELEKARTAEVLHRESAARRNQSLGKRRLKAAQTVQAARQAEVEEVREARFQHDAQRVLQLKGSIDRVNRQINGQNEAKRKKQQKVREEREQRKKDMLNEGLNPYEVWRREEMEADKEKQKELLKAKTELRSEKLIEQLIKEDITYKRKQKEAREEYQRKEDFQREMGNYAKEKRIAQYIRKVTIGSVDVLDPTGTALRIDPSKVTVQKTHAFGLGRVRPDEITKVDRELKVKKAITNYEKAHGISPGLATRAQVELSAEGLSGWAEAKVKSRPPPRQLADNEGEDSEDDFNVTGDAIQPEEDAVIGGDPDEEGATEQKLWVPKLTILEQKYLAAAKERQKQNITSVQRCWGKEFKGDAFLAKPSIIAFNDFEVGKRYRQVIEVTNISLTFNQFKLLPLDNKVKDFFEIVFVPPGRMSAGVTRYITIWFVPKVYQDIETTFPILAKTGRIDFPLQCYTKKTLLTITPQDAERNPIIDFGKVLQAESGYCNLQIKNAGALPAGYLLEAVDLDNELLTMMTFSPEKSQFKAHGNSKIEFVFTPKALGKFETILILKISNGAIGDARYEDTMQVLVRGECVDVPIYVEKEEYDMKTCIFEHTFRENVVLHNRQSVAMKINVVEPKQIIGQLQLNPTVAYIQGYKSMAVQVKFSPGEDFLDRNQQFRDKTRPGVQGAFRIPVKILGADQELPVCTALIGILTTNFISFEPSILNFGPCFLGSAVTANLQIVNESLLPQQYAFVRLPSFLTVEDVSTDVLQEEEADPSGWGLGTAVLDGGGHGVIGTVLPQEKKRVSVTYCPDSATEMDYKITFKAITGSLCSRTFTIPCKGQGRKPIISFSSSQIDLASIPCDATSKESFELTNRSNAPYTMNLLLPPSEVAALYVSPICCTLQPKETRRLQVEFKPTEAYINLLQMPPREDTPPPDAEEGAADAAAAPGEPPPEGEGEPPPPKITPEEHRLQKIGDIRQHGGRRWEKIEDAGASVFATWKLPILIRPKVEEAAQKDAPVTYLYAGVKTCVLPTVLTVDPEVLPTLPSVEPMVLDFGEVTAQQRMILPITLQKSKGVEEQELHMDPLPENACFTVLNATRTIGSRPFKVLVEFNPQVAQIYQSTLRLYTQSTRVQVQLKGKGVRPILKIKPEDGVIQVGSVVYSKACADYVTANLEIENDSPFELAYNLETVLPAEPHHVGVGPFTLTPSTGTVAKFGSRTVTVTFRPHRPLAVFREKVLVNVPNQKEPTYVYLYGHCFAYQMYAMPYLDFGPFGSEEARRGSGFLDSVAVGVGAAVSAEGQFAFASAQQRDFCLEFKDGERMKSLLVGASVPPGTPTDPKAGPATAFEFQILPSEFSNYFTVEAPEGAAAAATTKGQVLPGKPATKVAFRYKPPEDSSLTCVDMKLDLLSGIGKWITCKVRGVLTGGTVPPGEGASQEISVELKAYLQQI